MHPQMPKNRASQDVPLQYQLDMLLPIVELQLRLPTPAVPAHTAKYIISLFLIQNNAKEGTNASRIAIHPPFAPVRRMLQDTRLRCDNSRLRSVAGLLQEPWTEFEVYVFCGNRFSWKDQLGQRRSCGHGGHWWKWGN